MIARQGPNREVGLLWGRRAGGIQSRVVPRVFRSQAEPDQAQGVYFARRFQTMILLEPGQRLDAGFSPAPVLRAIVIARIGQGCLDFRIAFPRRYILPDGHTG